MISGAVSIIAKAVAKSTAWPHFSLAPASGLCMMGRGAENSYESGQPPRQAAFPCAAPAVLCREWANKIPARGISPRDSHRVFGSRRQPAAGTNGPEKAE